MGICSIAGSFGNNIVHRHLRDFGFGFTVDPFIISDIKNEAIHPLCIIS